MHDLSNVLHVVAAHTSMVRTRAHGRDAEALDHVLEAAQRASELMRRVLEGAHPSPAAGEPADLGSIVAEALDLLAPSAPPQVRLVRRLQPALPLVRVGPTELRRVIMNLVLNAWQACEERRGEVVVTSGLGEGGDRVWLEVTDDGRGMDAATAARIFEPFFSTRDDGHGLGLSLVGEIVERHDGAIEVTSRPGEGARFRVTLPALLRGAPASD
jgi:signal transduction histidine kinase